MPFRTASSAVETYTLFMPIRLVNLLLLMRYTPVWWLLLVGGGGFYVRCHLVESPESLTLTLRWLPDTHGFHYCKITTNYRNLYLR